MIIKIFVGKKLLIKYHPQRELTIIPIPLSATAHHREDIMAHILQRDTIGDITRRTAARYRTKKAIIFRDITLTFEDLERESCKFASLMLEMGIRKGDRVAVNAYNSHYYPISFFGLAKIGAVQVPINYMLNGEEISYIVNHSASRMFITEDSLYPAIQGLRDKFTTVEHWGFIPLSGAETPAGFFNLETALRSSKADPGEHDVCAEDIAQIPYTSGTESRPKGAMLSHRALMSQYYSCIFEGEYNAGETSLHALPLFHCAQLHCFLAPLLYTGATNIILHKADPVEMVRSIEKYRVTHMFAPPTVWIGILNNPELAKLESLEPRQGGLRRQHHAGGDYQAALRDIPGDPPLELLRPDGNGPRGNHPPARGPAREAGIGGQAGAERRDERSWMTTAASFHRDRWGR